jgi:signal transduction histidine kinase
LRMPAPRGSRPSSRAPEPPPTCSTPTEEPTRPEQGKTFEPFYRATAATKNAIAGTGLGLAIVKLTAEAHGGTVSLESVEGEGTTFRVVLPLPTELVPAAA